MRISDWSSDVCSSDLGRQIFVLDCLGAEPIDRPGGHIMDGNERTGGGTAIGHRLHDDRGLESDKPYAAGFFRHIDAVETKLRRRGNGFGRAGVMSAERRVEKQCVSTCERGGGSEHKQNK